MDNCQEGSGRRELKNDECNDEGNYMGRGAGTCRGRWEDFENWSEVRPWPSGGRFTNFSEHFCT